MPSIKARIKALEDARKDTSMHIVVVEDGESKEAALIRFGLLPDVKIIFITPLDLKL